MSSFILTITIVSLVSFICALKIFLDKKVYFGGKWYTNKQTTYFWIIFLILFGIAAMLFIPLYLQRH